MEIIYFRKKDKLLNYAYKKIRVKYENLDFLEDCKLGNFNRVFVYTKNGFSLKIADKAGLTGLMLACSSGN